MKEMKELNTSKLQKHPIIVFAEKIEKEKCVVIDKNHTLPAMPYAYVSPQFVICLGHKGRVDLEYDEQVTSFEERNISVIYPNHSVRAISVSDDYDSTLIVVSSRLFDTLRMRSTYRGFLHYIDMPHFKLSDEQYKTLLDVIAVIRHVCDFDGEEREDMLVHILDVLVSMITRFRIKNISDYKEQSVEKRMFLRFYDTVSIYYKQSREVQFYAELFCLSPKYFGTLIRNETGIGAGDWIARYVVMQAKMLLRGNIDHDIQWVATELGFDDQASFSRYFKRVEGITPSEFRSRASSAPKNNTKA